ncbi:Uncharacterized protein OBRU01_01023 [Operophtera brumata]|uniref:Uncharacterized protein n=1 Tax=Operophtera brumata TaxID=104452 RepID=A0A0L7LU25_OPEBR|nr:Uncharacterized protein OBRU01_01023 [Operophtera brumata]
MRITANPLNYNYADPDDAIRDNGNVMVTSFDNPNSIELPSQNERRERVIDSTTYCKKPSRHARTQSGEGHWHPIQDDFDDNPVDKLASKEDCARLFEFDNDAPLIMENKDYREIVGLNRGTDDSRRTFAKPESPDYMHDSGIGSTSPEVKRATIVGNPMYSRGPAPAPSAPGEPLGIDDLHMDYDQIMHYFHNLKHISKAPIDVHLTRDTSEYGQAGDSTVDTRNNNTYSNDAHIYENVQGRSEVAPTQKLCNSIANNNTFMKTQLKFLLDNLSEAYE